MARSRRVVHVELILVKLSEITYEILISYEEDRIITCLIEFLGGETNLVDVILVLGTNDMNRPQDNKKLEQLLRSSINQPSSADVNVAIIRPHNGTLAFREFQDLEDTMDLVTFTKTLDTENLDEASVMIFNEKGRPNARRLILLVVNGTASPSDDLITQWNRTFVDNDVLVIPVVFGRQDDGEKFRPIAPESGVHIIEPDDDPTKKGEKIATEITKGKFID